MTPSFRCREYWAVIIATWNTGTSKTIIPHVPTAALSVPSIPLVLPTGLSFTAPNVSMACYQRHLKPYSNKTDFSMCDLMDRCQQCNNWMTKKLMERHQCRGRNSARFANNR